MSESKSSEKHDLNKNRNANERKEYLNQNLQKKRSKVEMKIAHHEIIRIQATAVKVDFLPEKKT